MSTQMIPRRQPNYYRLSTPEEQDRYTARLGVILELIGVLHSTLYDLIDAMDGAGILRHRAKVDVQTALDYAERLHGICFKVVQGKDEKVARSYNDCYEQMERDIAEAVLVAEPLVRYYSIATALCRIIIRINDTQMGRFRLPMISFVENAQKRLKNLAIDDKGIDVVIEGALRQKRPKMFI